MKLSERINSKMSATDYAGKYLREYESARYSLLARAVLPLENVYNIIVPADAEEFADVSFYQEDINWDEYRKHARAAILRIGQGSWEDIKFERNYSEGKRVGCLIGGYWFYDGRVSPQQQAGMVIAAMWGKAFELELYVDWERNYSGAHEGLQNVVAFMQLLDAAGLKVKDIGLYSGYYWFLENSNAVKNAGQYNYLKDRPLFLAWYAAASLVKIPAPWTDYTLWQWGTPVLDWGQKTKEIDMNKSRYNRTEFEKRYINGGTSNPPTEPTGGTMPGYKCIKTVNVRNASNVVVAALKVGDRIWGTAGLLNGLQRVTFNKIYRATGVVDTWTNCNAAINDGSVVFLQAISDQEPNTTPPPSGVVITSVTVNYTEDGVQKSQTLP